MGINKEAIYLVKKWMHLERVNNFNGLRICEFGNQHIRHQLLPYKTGKEWLTSLGAEHVSFDINGEDNALIEDLSKPLPFRWNKYFDLITNFGTSEHVVGQYQLFKNIHNMLKESGYIIHCVPQTGSYPFHSPFKYSMRFFDELSTVNKYVVVFLKSIKRRKGKYQICSILKKTTANEFITESLFMTLKGLHTEKEQT